MCVCRACMDVVTQKPYSQGPGDESPCGAQSCICSPLWPWGDNLCTPRSRTPRFRSKQKGGFLTSPLLLQLNIGHGHGPGPGPGPGSAAA